MNFSELTIRLVLLFFPGIICHLLVDLYTPHRERRTLDVLLHSFVYGISAYLIYSLVLFVFGFQLNPDHVRIDFPKVQFVSSLTNSNASISLSEIGTVAIIGAVLGIGLSYCINKSWHFRPMQKLGVTSKFSDPNVWAFTFNLEDVEWAVVRDHDQRLMYFGYIRAFRDIDEIAELLLVDVTVSNLETGEELYSCDKVYLARPHDNVTIDLPKGGALKNA